MVTSTAEVMIIYDDDRSYGENYRRTELTPALFEIPNSQAVNDLMVEGYRSMADIHAKYAEITFKAISEVVP